MSLSAKLAARTAQGKAIRVGLIGAGKFGSMFLAQVPTTPGLKCALIADLDIGAREARRAAPSAGRPGASPQTLITDDARGAAAQPGVDVVIEATGDPAPASRMRSRPSRAGKHIVMVNVEADVLAGPLLAARGAAGRRGLFAGLWRPAGADRGDGRLGARQRVSRSRRREGHEIPAEPTIRDARRACGAITG